jgi:hypothetical protein
MVIEDDEAFDWLIRANSWCQSRPTKKTLEGIRPGVALRKCAQAPGTVARQMIATGH